MPDSSSKVVVHDCSFVPCCPRRPVLCVAGDQEKNRVAVLRHSGSIEVFSAGDSPYLIYRLEPDYTREELRPRKNPAKDESSETQATPYWATAIAFAGNGRLFAIGAHGFVFEVLVDRFNCAGKVAHAGLGLPTAIAAHGQQLVVGTDNGFVVLFGVDSDGPGSGPCFDKKLPRVHESPVTSLAWSSDGKLVAVTTNAGVIAVIDVESGQMNPISRRPNADCVNTVAFLGDRTVVTGDKKGTVAFWDTKSASMVNSFAVSPVGILCMASKTNDDDLVFLGGEDTTVYSFARGDVDDENAPPMKAKKRDQEDADPVMQYCYKPAAWVESLKRRLHARKITSMVHVGPWLISGSADGQIYFSQRKHIASMPPLVDASRFQVLKDVRQLMVSYRDRLVFYPLEDAEVDENTPGECIDMDVLLGLEDKWLARRRKGDDPKEEETAALGNVFQPGQPLKNVDGRSASLIIEPSATKVGASVVSGAALDDGSVIAYSLNGEVRVLAWCRNGEQKPAKKLAIAKGEDVSVMASQKLLSFASGFLSVTAGGSLQVLDCTNRDAPVAEPAFKLRKKSKRKSAIQEEPSNDSLVTDESTVCVAAAVSSDARLVAVSFSDRSLFVVDAKRRKVLCRVLKHNVPITTLAVNDKNYDLIVGFANRTVVEYSGEKLMSADFHEGGITSAMTEWSRRWVAPDWWKKNFQSLTSIIPREDTHLVISDSKRACVIDKKKSLEEENNERAVTCFTACKFIAKFARVSENEFVSVNQLVPHFFVGVEASYKRPKFGKK